MLIDKVKQFPLGYSVVYYQNIKYSVSRSKFNQGKSMKLYAKDLAGEVHKPCEMPERKVIDFINNFVPVI